MVEIVNEDITILEERFQGATYNLRNSEESLSINDKKVSTEDIKDRSLTVADLKDMRGNTKGLVNMIAKLDNEALKSHINTLLANVYIKEDVATYEELLINVVIRELVNRL